MSRKIITLLICLAFTPNVSAYLYSPADEWIFEGPGGKYGVYSFHSGYSFIVLSDYQIKVKTNFNNTKNLFIVSFLLSISILVAGFWYVIIETKNKYSKKIIRKKTKFLINSYLPYVTAFWAISYFTLLCRGWLWYQNIEITSLLLGIVFIGFLAFAFALPFYIWLTIRAMKSKTQISSKNLYIHSFFAGILTPLIYFWAIVAFQKYCNVHAIYYFIVFAFIYSIATAEICIYLNMNTQTKSTSP